MAALLCHLRQGSRPSPSRYPHREELQLSDGALLQVLEQDNLPDLARRVGGLHVERDWGKVLSVGEQQRLAFARVLLARPRYAMLDEATSALDVANEESLYRTLATTDTTLVSVGHRTTLLKHHRQVLELTGDGGWQWHRAENFRFPQ